MCGTHHNHGSGGEAVPVDTLEITIAPSGVIKIVTGKMVTSHATVSDAIAAFARAAGVTIESSARVIKGLVHERTAERTKA